MCPAAKSFHILELGHALISSLVQYTKNCSLLEILYSARHNKVSTPCLITRCVKMDNKGYYQGFILEFFLGVENVRRWEQRVDMCISAPTRSRVRKSCQVRSTITQPILYCVVCPNCSYWGNYDNFHILGGRNPSALPAPDTKPWLSLSIITIALPVIMGCHAFLRTEKYW